MKKLCVITVLLSITLFLIAINGVPLFTPKQKTIHVDLDAYVVRAGTNTLVFLSHNSGVLTTDSEVLIKTLLGVGSNSSIPIYISVSSSTSTPSSSWHVIPGEITTNGFERALGTYTSTGDNTWTIKNWFTVTSGTIANVQLAGLNWGATGASPGNLFCSDTFTPHTLAAHDSLVLIWAMTII